METESKEAREMVLKWYAEGAKALDTGKWDPPLYGLPMTAYARGWEDAINGVWPSDDEIIKQAMR